MLSRNQDTSAAREYHEATKHSYISIRSNQHYLDWNTKPLLYKIYPGLETIPLHLDPPLGRENALKAINYENSPSRQVDLKTLAEILYLGAGLTKVLKYGSENYYHRAASCAGALYPIEIYLVTGPVSGLSKGLYHFCPGDFALRKLRDGDFRTFLASSSTEPDRILSSAATLVFTAIFWRSAWKYRARSYRYCFWDAGTILANMVATSTNAMPRLITAFLDREVNALLDLDPAREAALCMVPIGTGPSPDNSVERVAPLRAVYIPLSQQEVEYKSIQQLHSASSLKTREELEIQGPRTSEKVERNSFFIRSVPLPPFNPNSQSAITIGETILRRGSTRRFARKPISLSALSAILQVSTSRIPSDFLKGPNGGLAETYLIVNAVEELPEGAYYYSKPDQTLELLKEGRFRSMAGYLCLEQQLPADASAVAFFMADLDEILAIFGNRGYRLAHLEAGIRGGRMYLATYAQRLGATGLTFFDDDVTEFFSPHGKGKSCLLVVALGVPAYPTHPTSWRRVPLRDPMVESILRQAKNRQS